MIKQRGFENYKKKAVTKLATQNCLKGRTENYVFDDARNARARGNYFRTDGRGEELTRLESNANMGGHVVL